jgi:cytochrome c-type biogenesis protein
MNEASASRGAILSAAYCVGLGIPFVAAGLAFGRAMRVIGWLRRRQVMITRLGGAMMIATGALLASGLWYVWTSSVTLWAVEHLPAITI